MVKAYDANKIQIKQFLNAQLEMINVNEMELDSGTNLAEEMINRIKDIQMPNSNGKYQPPNLDDTIIFEGGLNNE